MGSSIQEYTDRLDLNDTPAQHVFSRLVQKIDFEIDPDFLSFYKRHDGASGNVGKEGYVHLWNIDDIILLNPYYEDVPVCKELFFFGSDGSNLGYAFDKVTGSIVAIDYLEIGRSSPTYIADSFKGFLIRLKGF